MKIRNYLAAGLAVLLFGSTCFAAQEGEEMDFSFAWQKDALEYRISVNGEEAARLNVESYVRDQFKSPEVIQNYGGQGASYIWLPNTITGNLRVPVIVAAHGSGRGGDDYYKTDFYAEQRKIAKANGYVFAVITNDRDGWGTDDGTANLLAFCRTLPDNWPVKNTLGIWATSAGGVTALRTIAAQECDIAFFIGTFPVYDLITEYSVLPSCRAAFGDIPAVKFAEMIQGKNPADQTEALLASGCKFYVTHGDADKSVPYAANAKRMAEDLGDAVTLETIPGGVHGTDDYSFYGAAVAKAFENHPAVYTWTGDLKPGDVLTLSVVFPEETTEEIWHVNEAGILTEGLPAPETEPETAPESETPEQGKSETGWILPAVIAAAGAALIAVIAVLAKKKVRKIC